jgi:hypothetical protein
MYKPACVGVQGGFLRSDCQHMQALYLLSTALQPSSALGYAVLAHVSGRLDVQSFAPAGQQGARPTSTVAQYAVRPGLTQPTACLAGSWGTCRLRRARRPARWCARWPYTCWRTAAQPAWPS